MRVGGRGGGNKEGGRKRKFGGKIRREGGRKEK